MENLEKSPFAKEKIMPGATEEATKGVPEFEDLRNSLDEFLTAQDEIKNFTLSPEWKKWEDYRNAGNSPQREEAKKAAKDKLDKIEETIKSGQGKFLKLVELFRTDLEK